MRKDGESTRIPKIAILFSLALEGERNMCRGILDYARSHGPWRCHLVEGRPEEQLMNLRKERFDGMIAAGGTREKNASFASVGAPFVLMEPRPEMLGPDGTSTFPFVTRDSRAIGALAASYYLKRGYKSFAYVGETSGWFWNAERRAGFEEALAQAGFKCAAYDRFTERERRSWTAERPRMERFLFPLLCQSTVPPLSSIRTGGYRRGQTAAAMLDALMRGHPVERRSVVQEPISVVTRGSTGYDAMSDLYVARAVKFIRDRIEAGEVIDVADVVREAHCSRRYLERHFRAGLGRSVHDELMLARLERVKAFLEETTLPIGEISAEVGYTRPSRLAAMFRRETGVTMRQWRLDHREANDN